MKLCFLILLSLIPTVTYSQDYKAIADSFILAKTSPEFIRLVHFDTMLLGDPFEPEVNKLTQRFLYVIRMPSGQKLHYKFKGSTTASFVIKISIDRTDIIIAPDDLPDSNKVKKLERLYSTAFISKREATDTAEKYLYTENISKNRKSWLVHDFNIDSTYWLIEIDTGKRKMLQQQVYVDAITNRFMKTLEMKYTQVHDEDILTSKDETAFPFQAKCFGCPEDSSDFNATIIPDYFLLGTLSDYTGRFRYIEREIQVDRYYPFEEPLLNYISAYIKEYYKIKADTIFELSRHGEIYAQELAIKLNRYYTKDGRLLDSVFKTEEQVYSFLLGNYYRYGQKISDKIYKIQIVNSTKDQQLYPMLKKVHCDKIIYKLLRGYIPTSDIFYFEATPKLIKYFNTIEAEKQKLSASYKRSILSGEYGKKFWRYENDKNRKEQKELERVFGTFIEK